MYSFLFMKEFYEMRESIGTIHNKPVYHPLEVSLYSEMKPKRDIQEVKDIVQDIEEKTIHILKKSEEPLLFPSLDETPRVNVSKNKQQVKDTSVKDTSVKDTKVKDTSVKDTKVTGGDATVNEKKDDIDDIDDVSVKDVTVDVDVDVDDDVKDVTVDNATNVVADNKDIELLGGTSSDVKTISIKKDYVVSDK